MTDFIDFYIESAGSKISINPPVKTGSHWYVDFEINKRQYRFNALKDVNNAWSVNFTVLEDGDHVDKRIRNKDSVVLFKIIERLLFRFLKEIKPAKFYFSADSRDMQRVTLYIKYVDRLESATDYVKKKILFSKGAIHILFVLE